jgi:hypothetical protein
MRRGASCAGSIDYLRTDWFTLAEHRVEEVREQFCVVAKSSDATEAGSVGPWERGGISPFQLNSGRSLADTEARPYEAYGAAVA